MWDRFVGGVTTNAWPGESNGSSSDIAVAIGYTKTLGGGEGCAGESGVLHKGAIIIVGWVLERAMVAFDLSPSVGVSAGIAHYVG